MDKEIFWKGSYAVGSARTWIAVFSWLAIIAGILVAIFTGIEFEMFLVGCCIIGAGISGLILKGILRGFETIVEASEAYLRDREDLKEKTKQSAE